jgi:hypothetical protein
MISAEITDNNSSAVRFRRCLDVTEGNLEDLLQEEGEEQEEQEEQETELRAIL